MKLAHMTLSHLPGASPRPWLAGLCVGALLLLPGAAAAQDTDDDGVLPCAGGSSGNSAGGGAGGAMSSDSASGVFGVSTIVEAAQTDPTIAHVRVEALTGPLTVVEGVPSAEATFDAQPGTAVIEPTDQGLLMQGEGGLGVPDTLPMTFEAAEKAIVRTVILLLDDGSSSLGDLLAGKSHPDQVVVVGDVPAVGLQAFHALVAQHEQDLPGMGVTLVFVSVDTQGLLHLSAVRAATDGGPLEIVTH